METRDKIINKGINHVGKSETFIFPLSAFFAIQGEFGWLLLGCMYVTNPTGLFYKKMSYVLWLLPIVSSTRKTFGTNSRLTLVRMVIELWSVPLWMDSKVIHLGQSHSC